MLSSKVSPAEPATLTFSVDYQPATHDVCCGRGKRYWNHTGNERYRELIRLSLNQYSTARTKRERNRVAKTVVDTIYSEGGRFIRTDQSDKWHDIGYKAAIEKADHSLRDHATPQKVEKPDSKPIALPKGYIPSDNDVILGKGKKNWHHQGNIRFRQLTRSQVKAYQKYPEKEDRDQIIRNIIQEVLVRGGRFVRQNEDGDWFDIGEGQARDKVDHSLRDQVYVQSKQQQQEEEGSATLTTSTGADTNSSSSGTTGNIRHQIRSQVEQDQQLFEVASTRERSGGLSFDASPHLKDDLLESAVRGDLASPIESSHIAENNIFSSSSDGSRGERDEDSDSSPPNPGKAMTWTGIPNERRTGATTSESPSSTSLVSSLLDRQHQPSSQHNNS